MSFMCFSKYECMSVDITLESMLSGNCKIKMKFENNFNFCCDFITSVIIYIYNFMVLDMY